MVTDMKPIVKTSFIATFFYASTAVAEPLIVVSGEDTPLDASLTVVEKFDPVNRLGTYDVTNNTGGDLIGFGVSNNRSTPGFINSEGNGLRELDWDTTTADNDNENSIGYEARWLNEFNWYEQEVIRGLGYTFSQIFGDFSDVAGDEDSINWYGSFDWGEDGGGALANGNTVSDFFAFQAYDVASSVIGVTRTTSGVPAYFTAGEAIIGTTNAVPLPATGWLMITGLVSLITLGRKRRADRTA